MRLIFYFGSNRGRSEVVLEAWRQGLGRFGLQLPVRPEQEYRGVEADVAIMYGLWGNNRRALHEYAAAGAKAVLCDLGYWGRLDGGKPFGFHRLAVNAEHATAYFQRIPKPADRWRYFNVETRPFGRRGHHVVLAGMSSKAAWVYDLRAQAWETSAVQTLRKATARPIWYRPKPSWREATPIAGTMWAHDKAPIDKALDNCHALVTHHGNAALDALIAGVPVFCEHGIARPLALDDLGSIETPHYPDPAARDQLLRDAAYTQYKVSEIAEGKAWRYLNDEGLI